MKLGKTLFRNILCWEGRKQRQTTAPNVASLKRYRVPTGIDDLAGEFLRSMASQDSIYDTVMTSTSMPSQYIEESSHN